MTTDSGSMNALVHEAITAPRRIRVCRCAYQSEICSIDSVARGGGTMLNRSARFRP